MQGSPFELTEQLMPTPRGRRPRGSVGWGGVGWGLIEDSLRGCSRFQGFYEREGSSLN